MKERWLDQVIWADKKADQCRRWHYRLRLTTIVGGVILPALVGISVQLGRSNAFVRFWLPNLAFGLSQVIAVSAAVEEFCRFGDRWRDYRRMSEDLKAEGWQYLQASGPYEYTKTPLDSYTLFAGRVESIIKNDVQNYIADLMKQQAKQDQEVEQIVEEAKGVSKNKTLIAQMDATYQPMQVIHPAASGHPTMASNGMAYAPAGYPTVPGYPGGPGYPPNPGYPVGYPAAPGYPVESGYPVGMGNPYHEASNNQPANHPAASTSPSIQPFQLPTFISNNPSASVNRFINSQTSAATTTSPSTLSPSTLPQLITTEQLVQIGGSSGNTNRLREFAPAVNQTLDKYQINTPLRIAHFLAQIMHESGGFQYVKEIWGPNDWQVDYEGREDLGNTQPGDGKRFMGRGLIQLTGRANYKEFSKAMGVDFIAKPELVEQPPYAVLVAGWYWNSRDINQSADTDDNDWILGNQS